MKFPFYIDNFIRDFIENEKVARVLESENQYKLQDSALYFYRSVLQASRLWSTL